MASGSGWNLWVWLLGVVVRRYIDFLILLIPTPLVCSFLQHPYFLFIFKMFFILVYIYRLIDRVLKEFTKDCEKNNFPPKKLFN